MYQVVRSWWNDSGYREEETFPTLFESKVDAEKIARRLDATTPYEHCVMSEDEAPRTDNPRFIDNLSEDGIYEAERDYGHGASCICPACREG